MSDVRKYVVVCDGEIVGGPYEWNGMTDWSPPEEGTLLLEDEALSLGYEYPVDQQEGVEPDPTRKVEE